MNFKTSLWESNHFKTFRLVCAEKRKKEVGEIKDTPLNKKALLEACEAETQPEKPSIAISLGCQLSYIFPHETLLHCLVHTNMVDYNIFSSNYRWDFVRIISWTS